MIHLCWSGIHAARVFSKIAAKVKPRFAPLMDPQHPLLNKLQTEAPGTFHHSIMVGSMAAPAALKIGADPDLARVIGYYHDIGKLHDPGLYIEQHSLTRQIEKIVDDPTDLIAILSHAQNSRQILIKEGFPMEVYEQVAQHHGTIRTRIRISPELLDILPESILHYRGPLPSTRESAIVMLADSCQAMFERKSHAEGWPENPSREFLREFVDNVGQELRRADQFRNSILNSEAQNKVQGCIMWWLFRFYNNLEITGTPNRADVRRISNPPKNSI